MGIAKVKHIAWQALRVADVCSCLSVGPGSGVAMHDEQSNNVDAYVRISASGAPSAHSPLLRRVHRRQDLVLDMCIAEIIGFRHLRDS